MRPRFLPAPVAVLVAALVAPLAILYGAGAQAGPAINLIAVDADPQGNTATSLGPLNACTRAEPGATVTVDVVVDAVPGPPTQNGIVGFELYIDYPADLVSVTAVDHEFLLGAVGTYAPFEGLSDPLPDSDGRYYLAIADLATNDPDNGSNVEEGPGVLARLTLTAKAAGIAGVSVVFQPPDIYPTVLNNQNVTLDVQNLAAAQIAIGQDCPVPPESAPVPQPIPPFDEATITPTPTPGPTDRPPPATPTPGAGSPAADGSPTPPPTPRARTSPTPTANPEDQEEEGDGGASAGTIALVVVLVAAGGGLAGAGGYMLYRRSHPA